MFKIKRESLFEVPVKESKGKAQNMFIQGGLATSAETFSTNGALKYSTTGNDFLDQFGSIGTFLSPRSFEDIASSMQVLYGQDKLKAIKFTLYLRLISRKCKMFNGSVTETVQRGAGLKHESIVRMVWLSIHDKKAFWENIELFISVGSWKDIFEMLRYDLEYNDFEEKKLDWNGLGSLILAGLENPETSELVKKYLPQIMSKSKCLTIRTQANTLIGKYICNRLFGEKKYKQYRKLKSSGKAHNWQQLISKRLYTEIDFDSVHGRALSKMVSSKFLTNSGLEQRYMEWIESKPVAKFTGFVHELGAAIKSPNMCGRKVGNNLTPYQKMTINKQFDGLVELAKDGVNVNSGLIVVRDTSSSMTGIAKGCNMSAFDIAKSLGLFFGSMLEDDFANTWIEFNNEATMRVSKGTTFVDRWLEDTCESYGSTNFQSVIDLFIRLLKSGVSESDFPKGIICISDGEFNRMGTNRETNFILGRRKLRDAGFTKEYCEQFKFVLWDIPTGNIETKFETYGETENVFYLSGYDASILSFLLGGNTTEDGKEITPKTDVELFEAAMNQEVLNLVSI